MEGAEWIMCSSWEVVKLGTMNMGTEMETKMGMISTQMDISGRRRMDYVL